MNIEERRGSLKDITRIVELIYYIAWLIPFVISGFITFKAVAFKEKPPSLLLYSVVFSCIFLITLFFLVIRKQQIRKRLINGYLFSEEYNTVTRVKDKERIYTTKVKLRALRSGVDRWIFRIRWTGHGDPKVTIKSKGCILVGPIEDLEWTTYEIRFFPPLKSGKSVQDVELEVNLPDPNRTARPFVTKSLEQFGKCGKFTMKVLFESKPFPKKAFFGVYDLSNGDPLKIKELDILPNSREECCKVDVVIPKTDSNKKYVINWY